jgi:phosphomannomutase
VLELLAREGRPMSALLAPYRERYFISGEINSEVADPLAKIEEIAALFSDARQDRLDGISIDYEDWHFNVRASNTEPLLRLCLESLISPEDMERRRDEVLALIRS